MRRLEGHVATHLVAEKLGLQRGNGAWLAALRVPLCLVCREEVGEAFLFRSCDVLHVLGDAPVLLSTSSSPSGRPLITCGSVGRVDPCSRFALAVAVDRDDQATGTRTRHTGRDAPPRHLGATHVSVDVHQHPTSAGDDVAQSSDQFRISVSHPANVRTSG